MAPPLDSPEVQAFALGFPIALLHAGVTLALLAAGGFLHAALSPHRDFARAREGNVAAAVSFGAALVALAIPLAQAMAASTALIELMLWGAMTVVVQLLVFRLIELGFKGLAQRAAGGDFPAATVLGAAKLASALVVAAAVSG